MSDSNFPLHERTFFRPWSVLLGFVAGFLLLAWAGRIVNQHDWHHEFTRFHPMIAPDSQYEPTVGEMCAIVRARCRSDQVLVIVGGNSILLGVGQPADRMWTRRLQNLLGPKYAVINLAFRGSSATDGGAIVAEVLRNEYPHQLYIANAAPMQAVSPIGFDTYRFLLLDAYYKHLLLPWPPRDESLKTAFVTAPDRSHAQETWLGAHLDRWLHFRDLWTAAAYTQVSTFPSPMMPDFPQAFWPRQRFADIENDYETIPFSTRFSPQTVAADLNITQKSTELYYSKDTAGRWRLKPEVQRDFLNSLRSAFPDPLKKRSLILLGRNSAFYTQRLAEDIRARDNLAYHDSVGGWSSEGYEALEYGKDFTPADYGDRSHLTWRGGEKLAEIVAPQVRGMASKLGYLKP